MIQTVLIDARTPQTVIDRALDKLRATELWGFDIETQDEARHDGLNIYNNAIRHVFDARRTVITGFSFYTDEDDTSYYVNMAHADVDNRMPESFWQQVFAAANPEAIVVAHNAPFELTMTNRAWGLESIPNIVCTLQMAVSHHGPDEYDQQVFYRSTLPWAFAKMRDDIIEKFRGFERGDTLKGPQQELLGKFIAKESEAAHSYNGFVDTIRLGYDLKTLTKSVFNHQMTTYKEVLKAHDASHMGQLTGDQVAAYGADDAYWAVRHYKHMLNDMMKNNPKALRAFFEQENPMVHVYAEAWREGIRLDLDQVFQRRGVEREDMAAVLRRFKANVRKALPFPDEPHPKLVERETWYAKNWEKKRKDIERWANSADSEDDFEQVYQVSNPVGNAWAKELGKPEPKGRLNVTYWQTQRALMYDLLRLPIQFDQGSVASDKEARGKIREKLTEDLDKALMKDLQEMAEIEQRMKLYLTPYTLLMDPETSRVYPSLSSQLATRRLATSFPNPMQLAKSGSSTYIRGFYLGDNDSHVVVSADWSAIELVLIGELSGGSGFRAIYGQVPYGDMHTGSAVDGLAVKWMPGLTEEEFKEFKFGRNPNNRKLVNFAGVELSPKDFYGWARGTAIGKGINFGYWYSGAVSTVGNNLGLTDKEHWELVDRYRARFPEEEAWRVGVQDEAAIYGYVELPDGHRRNRFEVTREWAMEMRQKFALISANPAMLSYADLAVKRLQGRGRNQVVNALIQGTCATLAKRSILRLRNELVPNTGLKWGSECRLMMPIHDELVFSVHKDAVMDFIPILRQSMQEHDDIVSTLPLNATVALGRTFRPFNKAEPKLTQIELDEAQVIEGVIEKDLEGTKLSDDKVKDILEFIFS